MSVLAETWGVSLIFKALGIDSTLWHSLELLIRRPMWISPVLRFFNSRQFARLLPTVVFEVVPGRFRVLVIR